MNGDVSTCREKVQSAHSESAKVVSHCPCQTEIGTSRYQSKDHAKTPEPMIDAAGPCLNQVHLRYEPYECKQFSLDPPCMFLYVEHPQISIDGRKSNCRHSDRGHEGNPGACAV